ncbi:hypothetical protein HD806DRAFT_535086 [Xylariaceae sp. AK1471]|nr:hypothetical protein HD806DRAFT_535086 [Xylariaceae sp. AK1471]
MQNPDPSDGNATSDNQTTSRLPSQAIPPHPFGFQMRSAIADSSWHRPANLDSAELGLWFDERWDTLEFCLYQCIRNALLKHNDITPFELLKEPAPPEMKKRFSITQNIFILTDDDRELHPISKEVILLSFIKCFRQLGLKKEHLMTIDILFSPPSMPSSDQQPSVTEHYPTSLDILALWETPWWHAELLGEGFWKNGISKKLWGDENWDGICQRSIMIILEASCSELATEIKQDGEKTASKENLSDGV